MWDEFRQTHKPKAINAFLILIAVFAVILGLGIYFGLSSYIKSCNYVSSVSNEPIILPITIEDTDITLPIQQTKNGQTEFTLPQLRSGNGPTSYSAYINCTISSTFVQNSPSNVTVDVLFPAITQADLNISTIFVQPVNALPAYKDWTSPTGYTSYGVPNDFLILWQTEDYGALQIWTSSIGISSYFNTYLFQDTGLIKLKITIYAEPTYFAHNYTDWSAFNSRYVPFVATVIIPNTFMDSIETVQLQQTQQAWQQSMLTQTKLLQSIENQSLIMQERWQNQQTDWKNQQDISGDMNLSLALFVLALMVLDVTIVVFDHSVDEKRKAEYDNKHPKQPEHNILHIPEYAI